MSLVLAHDRRRIVHFNVTAHPTAEWAVQQLREAFPFDQIPRYLLRDRDSIFGGTFQKDVKAMEITEVLSAPRGIHYNRGRPHSSLGPGLPEPTQDSVPVSDHRHKLPAGHRLVKTSGLGGLHHEYRLLKEAA